MRFFTFLAVLGICSVANAEPSKQMAPLATELLPKPLYFSKECKSVSITEWRTRKDSKYTDNYQVKEMDKLCQAAVKKFPAFLKKKNVAIKVEKDFVQKVSLIPWDSTDRNLNDSKYRFSSRNFELDDEGIPKMILGYHQRATGYIYVFNQVMVTNTTVNPQFKTVFTHELFHGMSSFYGVYNWHTGDKDTKEEEMAQEFTEYLGLGK